MRRWLLLLALVVAIVALAGWLLSATRPLYARADWRTYEEGGGSGRGRVVFLVGGCESCHATPGQDDSIKARRRLRIEDAVRLVLPAEYFPRSRGTESGRWKVVDLANALLAGVSPEDAHIYPALPYTSYSHMKLDDVRDLMAYLRTLQPVKGRGPAIRN